MVSHCRWRLPELGEQQASEGWATDGEAHSDDAVPEAELSGCHVVIQEEKRKHGHSTLLTWKKKRTHGKEAQKVRWETEKRKTRTRQQFKLEAYWWENLSFQVNIRKKRQLYLSLLSESHIDVIHLNVSKWSLSLDHHSHGKDCWFDTDILHKEGEPQNVIAKETGCTQSIVSTLYIHKELSRKKKCGKKRNNSNRDNCSLERIVKQNIIKYLNGK